MPLFWTFRQVQQPPGTIVLEGYNDYSCFPSGSRTESTSIINRSEAKKSKLGSFLSRTPSEQLEASTRQTPFTMGLLASPSHPELTFVLQVESGSGHTDVGEKMQVELVGGAVQESWNSGACAVNPAEGSYCRRTV